MAAAMLTDNEMHDKESQRMMQLDDNVFNAIEIVADKVCEKTKKRLFKIRWEASDQYPGENFTWEKEEDLLDPRLVADYTAELNTEIFYFEKIVGEQTIVNDEGEHELEYLLKWWGCSDNENTWVPASEVYSEGDGEDNLVKVWEKEKRLQARLARARRASATHTVTTRNGRSSGASSSESLPSTSRACQSSARNHASKSSLRSSNAPLFDKNSPKKKRKNGNTRSSTTAVATTNSSVDSGSDTEIDESYLELENEQHHTNSSSTTVNCQPNLAIALPPQSNEVQDPTTPPAPVSLPLNSITAANDQSLLDGNNEQHHTNSSSTTVNCQPNLAIALPPQSNEVKGPATLCLTAANDQSLLESNNDVNTADPDEHNELAQQMVPSAVSTPSIVEPSFLAQPKEASTPLTTTIELAASTSPTPPPPEEPAQAAPLQLMQPPLPPRQRYLLQMKNTSNHFVGNVSTASNVGNARQSAFLKLPSSNSPSLGSINVATTSTESINASMQCATIPSSSRSSSATHGQVGLIRNSVDIRYENELTNGSPMDLSPPNRQTLIETTSSELLIRRQTVENPPIVRVNTVPTSAWLTNSVSHNYRANITRPTYSGAFGVVSSYGNFGFFPPPISENINLVDMLQTTIYTNYTR